MCSFVFSISFRLTKILTNFKIQGSIFGIVCWENLRARYHLEDPGINGMIFSKWDGGMDRFDLAQNRDRWRALGIGVINLQVP
jgi:hypothetical protein